MQTKTSGRTKKTSKVNKNKNVLLYVIVIIVTLYVLYLIVDQQIRINNAKSELAQLEENIFTQEQTNAELKKVADAVEHNDEEAFSNYVEKIAREDLDYVKNGEVVFVNIAGD